MMVNEQMFDLNDSKEVEIQIRSDGKAVWVNVDGVCRVRVNNPVKIRLIDQRPRHVVDPGRPVPHHGSGPDNQ